MSEHAPRLYLRWMSFNSRSKRPWLNGKTAYFSTNYRGKHYSIELRATGVPWEVNLLGISYSPLATTAFTEPPSDEEVLVWGESLLVSPLERLGLIGSTQGGITYAPPT